MLASSFAVLMLIAASPEKTPDVQKSLVVEAWGDKMPQTAGLFKESAEKLADCLNGAEKTIKDVRALREWRKKIIKQYPDLPAEIRKDASVMIEMSAHAASDEKDNLSFSLAHLIVGNDVIDRLYLEAKLQTWSVLWDDKEGRWLTKENRPETKR